MISAALLRPMFEPFKQEQKMAATTTCHPVDATRTQIIAGRIVSGLAVAFLTFDAVFKLFAPPEAVAGTAELGWSPDVIVPLGILQLVLLALYLVPRTAVLGAVLWTGYLGGAVATHVRIDNPLFSHVLFPVYVAAFVWGGLWLRDARVRAMVQRW
jgi:hypothetical protein